MKIMAVDFGDVRTGLAMCDRTELLASPIGVITEYNFDKAVEKVAIAATEYDAQMVVVGNPINMNGTKGERSQKCEQFARELAKKVPIPIEMWDERNTTVSAINIMNETNTRGKKRKETVDSVAATIILESYLEYRKNQLKN